MRPRNTRSFLFFFRDNYDDFIFELHKLDDIVDKFFSFATCVISRNVYEFLKYVIILVAYFC